MGIETDTLDDDFSHPALYRGDYACLYAREKDQFYEPPEDAVIRNYRFPA